MNRHAHIQKGSPPSFITSFIIRGVLPVLLFFTAAAFLGSCVRGELSQSQTEEEDFTGTEDAITEIRVKSVGGTACLDVFFFNNDELRRLDSYQRIESDNPSSVTGSSRSGSKLLVLLANASSDRYDWADINSYEELCSHVFMLEDEDPHYPVMSAECVLEEGESRSCSLTLEPLMAMVELTNIVCDFSGKSYEGSGLDNVVVYISNVNAGCRAFSEEESTKLNLGGLIESDLSNFLYPEMILKEIGGPIYSDGNGESLCFFCYPNTTEEDLLGSPYTRLVIEGTIDGEVCYYPININRGEDGNGVERNIHYMMEVELTKRGTSDPDTPAEGVEVTLTLVPKDWEEQDNLTIGF